MCNNCSLCPSASAKMPTFQLRALYLLALVAVGACAQHELRLPLLAGYTNNNNNNDNNNDNQNNKAIHTEYVDRNNMTILAMFNVTAAEIYRRIANANANNNNDTNNDQRNTQYFEKVKEYRLNDIRYRLESAFNASTSEESQDPLLHEMAAYPICGSETNESTWLADNNVTIRFSDSLFEPKNDQLSLDSAILRLYKLDPNAKTQGVDGERGAGAAGKRCSGEPPFLDSQVRVTVSIVQQVRRNKRERKKRICNTVMMNVSKVGWVEIDIKRAIYIWENIEQQQQLARGQAHQGHQGRHLVGWLMIEVHDEEERPLKPGLFFSPPKCDQAELAIPWNYYGPHAALYPSAADQVPRCPRLDVTLTGYANWAAQAHSSSGSGSGLGHNTKYLQKKLPRSILLQQEQQQQQQLPTHINAVSDSSSDVSPLIAALRPHNAAHQRHTLPHNTLIGAT